MNVILLMLLACAADNDLLATAKPVDNVLVARQPASPAPAYMTLRAPAMRPLPARARGWIRTR